ncbi:hypothetical protein WME95_03315 [Sorangium sp. So ce327]|jgi:hypothetical protein|uniref:hypothetical protein n=1 Tax=unclassified Sorangium TaxID=2621164 RepID=UPI003F61AB2A
MTHDASDQHDDLEPPGDADPIVEACLADALGPYLGVLSPEELEDYRRFLTVFITTHPAAAPLHARLRAKGYVPAGSGAVAREGGGASEEAAAPDDGTSGGRH